MMKRKIIPELRLLAKTFPVISIFGPRQSGKTTLCKMVFSDYKYLNLEDFELRNNATSDPKEFIKSCLNENGVILDEVQNVPQLLSAIQVAVDENERPGFFILTGSQNLLLNESVSQSLAGRVAILTLLPFSIDELKDEGVLQPDYLQTMFKGLYPRIVAKNNPPLKWYPAYLRTYVERDVRQIKNIADLSMFQDFIGLCAGRIGQLLNISSLANDCGISTETVNSWLSILEASYIIFLLRPYHKNFSKRIIKSPKIYFYDSGLVCSILGIKSSEDLLNHYIKGNLFESFVISELLKHKYNLGEWPKLYFWRDRTGNEVDCIIEEGQKITAIEIKSGQTMNSRFLKGIQYWNKISENKSENGFVIYGGESNFNIHGIRGMGWKKLTDVFER